MFTAEEQPLLTGSDDDIDEFVDCDLTAISSDELHSPNRQDAHHPPRSIGAASLTPLDLCRYSDTHFYGVRFHTGNLNAHPSGPSRLPTRPA